MKDTLNQELLIKKIEYLEHKFDSLLNSNQLNQLEYQLNQKQDLISQVNDFYDSAWLKLLIVISVLGIIVPVLLQLYQRKSLKDLTEFISKQMNDNFTNKIIELKEFNKKEIDKTISVVKEDLTALESRNLHVISELDAGLYYLQGRTMFLDKNHISACNDFLRAAFLWLNSENIDRTIVALNNTTKCLKKLNTSDSFENINDLLKSSIIKKDLNELIVFFEQNEYYDKYTTEFEIMNNEIERIKTLANTT